MTDRQIFRNDFVNNAHGRKFLGKHRNGTKVQYQGPYFSSLIQWKFPRQIRY